MIELEVNKWIELNFLKTYFFHRTIENGLVLWFRLFRYKWRSFSADLPKIHMHVLGTSDSGCMGCKQHCKILISISVRGELTCFNQYAVSIFWIRIFTDLNCKILHMTHKKANSSPIFFSSNGEQSQKVNLTSWSD